MGSTRPRPYVQIYQDSMPPPNMISPVDKPRPHLQPSAMPLQPVKNPPALSAHPGPILAAPMATGHLQYSPQKGSQLSPSSNYLRAIDYVPNLPPPSNGHVQATSPAKTGHLAPTQHYRPVQMAQPIFTTFNSAFETFEQENFPAPASQDNLVDFPEPAYIRKQTLKRSYSDAQLPEDRQFKKARQEEETVFQLPEPEDMPAVEDDGNKPPYSYAQMIGMAILRAPNRRLTLAQIYEWISKTFAYYHADTKQSWHNSIRHNLSLHKAFTKQERPKGDAGKGSYWVIEPGMEAQFIKDKKPRSNTITQIYNLPNAMRPEPQKIAQQLSDALAPNTFLGQPSDIVRPQTAPALPDLSSDATLPASDPALNEPETADFDDSAIMLLPKSSPPDAINSSPPVVPNHHRTASSPSARMTRPSALHRQARSLTKNDDSGYFSSIESSALRPKKNAVVLTSELDIEPMRKKRGRAEEEIARIRSSSHDVTPSHARFRLPNVEPPPSSSPVRVSPAATMNPMTPAIVFKKPIRPPPSVSPNTQLLMHRKAMLDFANSPIRSSGLFMSDDNTYSPLKWSTLAPADFPETTFEIFADVPVGLTPATPVFGSSPLKRPSLARAATSSDVLSDVLGGGYRLNAKTPTRGSLLNPRVRASLTGSPLKSNGDPHIDQADDLFDFKSFENDASDDNDEGVDILQGFERIGVPSTQPSAAMTGDHMHRPSLGRSFTSRF
jgi:forkhead transcription factor HCM1